MDEVEIELRSLANDTLFHASIVGDKRNTTQSGDTKEEAIGKLVIRYPEVFGVLIIEK